MQTGRFEPQDFFGGWRPAWSYPLVASVLGGLFLVMPRFLAPEDSAGLLGIIGGSLILFALINFFRQLRHRRLGPFARRSRAISALYAELHQLMARRETEPRIEEQIRDRLAELRKLQEEEAEEMRQRFEANSSLKPGEGWKALREARELLARYEDPAAAHPSSARQD
jgi:hypothetical protein